ncbi:unnamed protein product [Ambrosiozyma monospora]|uniref:Unnamed protein product n=1 Tax=Ambrosiozyma monospora TaxID=43982 RepID=A0ACB5SYY5_AMBMO|nr:unnamed protein product [Ambrosiozyma monospora]
MLPPSLTSLNFKTFETNKDGTLPSTLISLDIDLAVYENPFLNFWRRFINPLENLLYLKISSIIAEPILDFTKLQIPSLIVTVELIFVNDDAETHSLVFDHLPSSLLHFQINCPADSHVRSIDVSSVEERSLDQLKNFLFILKPARN